MNTKIEILNKETHRDLQVNFIEARKIAQQERLLPVVISEFHSLMFEYPLALVKNSHTGEFTCSAILGVTPEESLLATRDMSSSEGLPLNVLRLPLLAIETSNEENESRPSIAIDMNATSIGSGERIMDESAHNFAVATSALSQLYAGYKETKEFVDTVVELGLISKLQVEVPGKDNAKVTLEGLYSIDINKMNDMQDADEATKNKLLKISKYVYALYFSLHNMKKLAHLAP